MADHDDVAVVVTCFNYGAYLHEAVASALEQEGGAPQVVVVDDGSTDPATLDALERLPDGVRLLRQANAGVAAARNAGIRATDTPYVVPLDADDKLAPGALRALRAPLDADAALGFAYGGMRFFGDWDADIPLPPFDPFRMLYRSVVPYLALMRREAFEAAGGYVDHPYEDWDLWLAVVAAGWRGTKVDATTHLYRRHGETRLSGARRQYRQAYRALRRRHADLYARRRELARQSDRGLPGQLAYRLYWGPRPIPAQVEQALYRRVFGR